MNRIFKPRGYFTVPDGTDVSPFLNASDVTQNDIPWGILGDMSVASGRIAPKTQSWVHTHLIVTQVTYVVSGHLSVRMRGAGESLSYNLPLQAGQAAVTEPGALFQLRNDSTEAAEVLYIVSPTYIFEMDGDRVTYDDATLVARTWEELETSGYAPPSSEKANAARAEALRRLAMRKAR
jgi:mannose-6-phosphate isomerase-like protein (cupin superfamily)